MLFSLILFGSLLAGGSCATQCFAQDKVNTSLLSGGYTGFCNEYPAPSVEYGDHFGKKFRTEFTEAIATRYGHEIAVLLLDQAKAGGDELVKTVKERVAKLKKSIESIASHTDKEICLDNDLNKLTRQLWVFLDLAPGNLPIDDSDLRELPEQQFNVTNKTKPRPLSDFFVNFIDVVDGVFANLYAYITGIFLNGWTKSRPYFKVFVAQFRNEILNGPVLDAYTKAVNEVFCQRDVIQSHVERGTWEYFTDAGVRIINISEEYQKSKTDQICL